MRGRRPLLVAAVAAATAVPAATAPAAAQVFKYFAFGDSITLGVFDTGEIGYPAKLETLLDDAGRPSDVVKRGVGGETTAAGLTRIDSVLAEGGQVILLMEGTNDVFNKFISVETAAANLAAMADKATAAGIDTVHMTIIPMKKECANAPHIKNPEASELADLVAQSAVDDGFWLVDVFDIWSGINNLYASYYYQGCEDGVGHPRNAGYWLMAQHIFDVLTGPPLPGAPVPTGPSGNAAATTFTWDEDANATWYELWIKDAVGATVHRAWHKASEHCASTCTVTPDPLPGAGDYTWTVQGRSPGGLGPVSVEVAFTHFDAPPTAAPVPTGPTGDVFVAAPDFVWDEVANATRYELWIRNAAGATVHRQWHEAAGHCASTCTVTPGPLPGGGDYLWSVQGGNPAGVGPASADLGFTYWAGPPAAATPLSPSGPTFATDPAFSWAEVVQTAAYRLEVENASGSLHDATYAASAICTAGTCSVTPTLGLTPDDYVWRLTTSNPAGSGPVSSDLDFEVRACTPGDKTVGPGSTAGSDLHEEVCGTITITGFTVESGDSAIFHAGNAVVFDNDTVFADGSTVTIRVE